MTEILGRLTKGEELANLQGISKVVQYRNGDDNE